MCIHVFIGKFIITTRFTCVAIVFTGALIPTVFIREFILIK